MSWTERNSQTNTTSKATEEKAKVLDAERQTSLPTILKEANEAKPFDPVKLQPVISPGIYESEFGTKDNDVIFHFWPYGYHDAERRNAAAPHFTKDFHRHLRAAMDKTFEAHRVVISEDTDVGATFVLAKNWGDSQFHRELCIKACELLHKLMGGSQG